MKRGSRPSVCAPRCAACALLIETSARASISFHAIVRDFTTVEPILIAVVDAGADLVRASQDVEAPRASQVGTLAHNPGAISIAGAVLACFAIIG